MKLVVSLMLVSMFFAGCVVVTGPETDLKSPLNVLNSDHYEKSKVIMGLPIVTRKEKLTEISGTVSLKLPLFLQPLRHVRLLLKDVDMKTVAELQSNSDGQFKYLGSLKNGRYTIEILSKHYLGKIDFRISGYLKNNISVIALSKSEAL